MVSRGIAYAVRLAGELDPSLPAAFGRVSQEVQGTERAIAEVRQEQDRLTEALRGVRRGTPEYRQLSARAEDLTDNLGDARRRQAALNDELLSVGRGTDEYRALDTELDDVTASIRRMESEQADVNRRLRGVDRGTDEYRQLERQIRDTRLEADRLNQELGQQQGHWQRLQQHQSRLGRVSAVGIGAIGGALAGVSAQIAVLGPQYSRLLVVAEETGLSLEQLQRFQLVSQAAGFELDAEEFREINIRLGEARAETERALREGGEFATASIGAAGEALRDLGLDARDLTGRDLPAILDALGGVDRELRQFYADEIFGGALGERILPLFSLPPELRAQLDEITVSSEGTARAFQRAYVDQLALRRGMGELAAVVGADLLPVMTQFVEAITPMVGAFTEFVANNPAVVGAVAGLGAAFAGITSALWLLNAALAVRAALSGPAGWAALGVAAAVGGATIIGGAYLGSRLGQDDDASDAAPDMPRPLTLDEYQRMTALERDQGLSRADAMSIIRQQQPDPLRPEVIQPDPLRPEVVDDRERALAFGDAVERGAYRGNRAATEEGMRDQEDTLRNILPTDCPEDGVAQAVREGLAGIVIDPTIDITTPVADVPALNVGAPFPPIPPEIQADLNRLNQQHRVARAAERLGVDPNDLPTPPEELSGYGAQSQADLLEWRERIIAGRDNRQPTPELPLAILEDLARQRQQADAAAQVTGVPVATPQPIGEPIRVVDADPTRQPTPELGRMDRLRQDPVIAGLAQAVDSINALGSFLSGGLLGSREPVLGTPGVHHTDASTSVTIEEINIAAGADVDGAAVADDLSSAIETWRLGAR